MTSVPRRAVVAASVDITRHYGNNLLLASELIRRGWTVDVIGPFGAKASSEMTVLGLIVHDLHGSDAPNGRLARRTWAVARMLRLCWSADLMVVAETGFAPVAAIARRLRPQLTYIQSCGEFYDAADGVGLIQRLGYRASVGAWDGCIDVDQARLTLRCEELCYRGPATVLPNTVASSAIIQPTIKVDRAVPVLVYAGSPNANADIAALGRSLARVREPFRLVCLFHGAGLAIEQATSALEMELGAERVAVLPPRSKRELIRYMAEEADIGLVHYPPRSVDSRGQRFAAPGKAFDYLAAALPIVATSNPSMRTLLADDQFGITATEDTEAAYASAVAVAIRRFRDGLTDRRHIAESFAAHWSADRCVPRAVTWIESVGGHRRSSGQRRRESPADANCTLDDSHLKR